MKRITCKTVMVSICIVVVLFLIYAFHANRRPFIPSDDFSATASVDGEAVEVSVFKPMYMEDVYYLHLDDGSDGRYSWLVFSPHRQSAADPIGVYHSWLGYTYTHADQASGVNLTDAKLEDDWKVVFDGDRIDLSNSKYQVEITRK
jgi:hypothetical protein